MEGVRRTERVSRQANVKGNSELKCYLLYQVPPHTYLPPCKGGSREKGNLLLQNTSQALSREHQPTKNYQKKKE